MPDESIAALAADEPSIVASMSFIYPMKQPIGVLLAATMTVFVPEALVLKWRLTILVKFINL